MTKTSRPFLAFALVGFSTLVGLVMIGSVGEAVVRFRETHRKTVPGSSPLMFYRHARLGFAFVRNSTNFGWIHINSAGFRGPEISLAKRPGVLRIAATGGSTTFDNMVSADDRTWPARLQYWLNRLDPNRPVEVLNAGVPGYSASQDLYHLENDVAPYRPDVIIELQGGVDLNEALAAALRPKPIETSNTPGEVEPMTPWGYWLSRHSLFYGKVLERLTIKRQQAAGERSREAPPDSAAFNARFGERLARFERDLAAFTTIGTMLGARVVLVQPLSIAGAGSQIDTSSAVQAQWQRVNPAASFRRIVEGYEHVGAAIDRIGKLQGVDVVTAAELGLGGLKYFAEGDVVHFNDAGADLMAKRLAESLIASGALNGAARTAPADRPR